MSRSAARPARSAGRRQVLAGLAGSALAAVGDVLMLGRPSSGGDFDRATGVVPAHVAVEPRWLSLWNGVTHSRARIHTGTVVGVVGIGLLTGTGLRAMAQALGPGPLRKAAEAAVACFAVSGVATHVCCGAVILGYRRASVMSTDTAVTRTPGTGGVTTGLLALSAVGTLGSLAALSAVRTADSLLPSPGAPAIAAVLTPFPCVLAALLTFGRLPTPIGGYARPASISLGLLAYFCVAAVAARPGFSGEG